jgi:hypothetical protein
MTYIIDSDPPPSEDGMSPSSSSPGPTVDELDGAMDRVCACGCGRILIKRRHQSRAEFKRARFASASCMAAAPRNRLYETRDQQIIQLAMGGLPQRVICRKLGLTVGTIAGVLSRAREKGDLPDLHQIPLHEPTRNPFPPAGRCLWPSSHEVKGRLVHLNLERALSFCGEPVCEIGGSWCASHLIRVSG